jgi:predicted helicase
MTDRLGIVYTPIEVVDFIIHSIEDVLIAEFGKNMADENVHIIDPFTGTGTFVTRLLQSGLIPKDRLPHKYKHELHANELVLLAYYIAAINIEATYHGIMNDNVTGLEESDQIFEVPYEPFNGICLTDTFQMYESEDMIDALLVENSSRRKRQKELDIQVIMGNPPYSIGQLSENDNNANVRYPKLDEQIRRTYAAQSNATLSKGLYDSYIRAIRWASERIGDVGVIGFVTNGGFLEKTAMDGVRKCLVSEFSSIYIFNLRGDIRKNMLSKGRAKEGGNVFGSGSMAGIAISILVKNTESSSNGKIYYHDVGSDLSREEKLEKITGYASLKGILAWQQLVPDLHGDWLNQRDESFGVHILLGDKKGDHPKLFDNFSLGVVTNRDAWTYNSSKLHLVANIRGMIDFYNAELKRFNHAHSGLNTKSRQAQVDGFINVDPARISWTRALKQSLARNKSFSFDESSVTRALYRPFTKRWMYFNRTFNEMVYQMPRIFPHVGAMNLVIQLSGSGARSGFSVLILDSIMGLDTIEKGQCFPLYLYDDQAQSQDCSSDDLFASNVQPEVGLKRRDAITDEGLSQFQDAYSGEQITKEDLFYYVYGILHSEDYRTRFADNLSKELPRIPKVKEAADFWAFSTAGRDLAKLHLNYETVEKYPLNIQAKGNLVDEDYRVTKMKFGKKRCDETGKNINDLNTVIYNSKITMAGIPGEAWDYVVNGKAALDWVMERQAVTTHKASGIVNDANDWALETMGNPKYPLELFQRVITVSLRTQEIVRNLPKLDLL